MDRYIGTLLDNRYEILELIGSGGVGSTVGSAVGSKNGVFVGETVGSAVSHSTVCSARLPNTARVRS